MLSDNPSRLKPLLLAGMGALIIAIGAAYWLFVYQPLKRSQVLVLGQQATRCVQNYVDEHEGKWPHSWADLDQELLNFTNAEKLNRTSYEQEILIDFDANPDSLADQAADDFVAIRPYRGFVVSYRDYWEIQNLISTLRKWHRTANSLSTIETASQP
jgi:hypothetical protein